MTVRIIFGPIILTVPDIILTVHIILTVPDWYRTSPANVDCPLRILFFWKFFDLDILFVKKSKVNAVFLIINE